MTSGHNSDNDNTSDSGHDSDYDSDNSYGRSSETASTYDLIENIRACNKNAVPFLQHWDASISAGSRSCWVETCCIWDREPYFKTFSDEPDMAFLICAYDDMDDLDCIDDCAYFNLPRVQAIVQKHLVNIPAAPDAAASSKRKREDSPQLEVV